MSFPPLRIALISEHASPLAVQGGVDAGGQNTYVAHVARSLAKLGHHDGYLYSSGPRHREMLRG